MNKIITSTIVGIGIGSAALVGAGTANADIERVQPGYTGSGTVFEPKQSAAAMVIQSAKPGEPLATGGAKVITMDFRTTELKAATDGTVTDSKAYAPAVRSYEAIRSGEERINSKSPESVPAGVAIGLGFKDDPLAPAE